MKRLSFILFLLISTTFSVRADLVQIESGKSDFENSSFIKFINQFNDGKIPYPFSNLMDSFKTGVRESGTTTLLVPQGRSLVKNFADYRDPRIIVEPIAKNNVSDIDPSLVEKWDHRRVELQKAGISGSEIYIGYAPKHNALEVISFNKKTNKFDFFVVEDYEQGKTPKIVSNPALCLSCHQNEAPLFPRIPWTEMTGSNTLKELDQNRNSQMPNKIFKKILDANKDRQEMQGFNLSKLKMDDGSVAFMDSLVRSSNTFIKDYKICKELCEAGKTENECKLEAMKILAYPEKEIANKEYFFQLKKRIQSINGISSAIANRDPETNLAFKEMDSSPEIESFTGIPGLQDITFVEEGFISTGGPNSSIIPIADKAFADPATPRPESSNIKKIKASIAQEPDLKKQILLVMDSCIDTSAIMDQFKNYSDSEKENIFNSYELKKELAVWPLSTANVLDVVEKKQFTLQSASQDEVQCSDNRQVMIPIYEVAKISKIVEKTKEDFLNKPAALFNKYCMQCHGRSDSFIPLPLKSMDEMANYIPNFGTTGVKERLETKVMPPPFAHFQPTPEERAEMIKLMKDLKKP